MLDWDMLYEVVLELEQRYPDVDLDTIGLTTLQQMVMGLPTFAAAPSLPADEMLTALLREWYEERNSL